VAAQRAVDHNPKKIDETDSDEDRQYFEWFWKVPEFAYWRATFEDKRQVHNIIIARY
jgi:hypothetical protein